MSKLNKVCFVINLFRLDTAKKQKVFEEIREYVCGTYPDDVKVVDGAKIVMRTTKVIREDIVDRFGLHYLGSRNEGWTI